MKAILNSPLFYLFWIALTLVSCSTKENLEVEYSFEVAKNVEYDIDQFKQIKFEPGELDLGFYKGNVWIKLEISNKSKANSVFVICNDLINRSYRFYQLNENDSLLYQVYSDVNLKYTDHRTDNFGRPNFQIILEPFEKGTYYINTSSDGRILQATPSLISYSKFQTIKQKRRFINVLFYSIVILILSINILYFRLINRKIYAVYGAYILSGCLMYLFVEGNLYDLGLSIFAVDHLMFISIRLWILFGVLFSLTFLDIKATYPKLYKLILIALLITLGLPSVYQLLFPFTSISHLHVLENLIGFLWIVLSLIILGFAFQKRKLRSTYYLISYSTFLFFVCLGLLDSHTAMLPGDPFSYFKIGTSLEFIGFTYFMTMLVSSKVSEGEQIINELRFKSDQLIKRTKKLEELNKLLENRSSIDKTDLIKVFTLLENSLSEADDWENFKRDLTALNPNFLNQLNAKHPELSESDIRLLVLIKIGHSQKEIANILSISPDSVKKARNRVRKRLNLDSDKNLKTYLDEIV